MCNPLPLRLCCMAAMAPALTEVTTQARIKIPASTVASPSLRVVNGTPHIENDSHDICQKRSNIANISKHFNHKILVGEQVKGKSLINTDNLSHLGFITKLPEIYKREKLIKHTRPNGNTLQSKTDNNTYIVDNKLFNNIGGDNSTAAKSAIPPCSMNGGEGMSKQNSFSTSTPKSTTSRESRILSSTNLEEKLINMTPPCTSSETEKSSSLTDKIAKLDDLNIEMRNIEEHEKNDATVDVSDISLRQHRLQQRADFLLRRLRRLQTKSIDSHTKEQLSGFVLHQHRNLQTMAKAIKPLSRHSNSDMKTDIFQSKDMKNLSTAALVNLVCKIQNSSLHSPRVSNVPKTETVSVLSMDRETSLSSEWTSSRLTTVMQLSEAGVDSDVTEDSSGGESADEFLPERERKKHVPLRRRAEWKWYVDRTAVASKWTWLQAQVSDLEYRIRQQNDICKQIRTSKGPVVLGEAHLPDFTSKLSPLETAKVQNMNRKNEMSPCNISTLLINVDRQASKLTQSLGNCFSPVQQSLLNSNKNRTPQSAKSLNGFIDTGQRNGTCLGPTGSNSSTNHSTPHADSPITDVTCQAARCLPVKSYRKRKLLRTAGLHHVSRKAARLSTVCCSCYPPIVPCALCAGRYNNSQTIDADVMSLPDRVALLDPAFHPVLSFSQDIPLKLHFEGLLKSGEWQIKSLPRVSRGMPARKRYIRRQKMVNSFGDISRKANKKLSKGVAAALLSARLKNKYEKKSARKCPTGSLPTTPKNSKKSEGLRSRSEYKRRRRAAKIALAALKKGTARSLSLSHRLDYENRSACSPIMKDLSGLITQSCPTTALKEAKEAALRRKRGESAYDINNIVIPYSMASSTRVEKLKYKEIVTPKWRDLTPEESGIDNMALAGSNEQEQTTSNGLTSLNLTEEDEFEDLSDEAYLQLHMRCEVQEKKRFMRFVTHQRRNTHRGMRCDSGATTPDPLSPDTGIGAESNVTGEAVINYAATLPMALRLSGEDFGGNRSRRGSISKRERSTSGDDAFTYANEIIETEERRPWTPLNFPLAEEDYEKMKSKQPVLEVRVLPSSTHSVGSEFETPTSSRATSPMPSSSSASICGDDDPNDPEWTSVNPDRTPKGASIILKLAKR